MSDHAPFELTVALGVYQFTARGTYIEVACAFDGFVKLVSAALSAGRDATAALAMAAATKGGNQH